MSAWETAGKSDDWYTPKYVFDALGCVFDLDVASPPEGPRFVPTKQWISENSLSVDWHGFIWMNPPFGKRNGLEPWLDKFFEHNNGVALTPDRTSSPWFQAAAKKASAILFVDGKIKFERPDQSIGKSPGSGTALIAAGHKGVSALVAAEGNGLGTLFTRMCK